MNLKFSFHDIIKTHKAYKLLEIMIQLNLHYEAIFDPRRSTSCRLLPQGRKNIYEEGCE